MTDAQVSDLAAVEACAELGIDRSTLTRWVKTGKLQPSRKLPGRTGAYLFRRSDIDALKTAASTC